MHVHKLIILRFTVAVGRTVCLFGLATPLYILLWRTKRGSLSSRRRTSLLPLIPEGVSENARPFAPPETPLRIITMNLFFVYSVLVADNSNAATAPWSTPSFVPRATL